MNEKVKEAKKAESSSGSKINKNKGLREEDAMITTKFRENITTVKTDDGVIFYKCNLCKETFHFKY